MQEKQIETQSRFLKGFADKTRLIILKELIEEEKSVTEIVKTTGLSQSNTSMHLACMLTCGIVGKTRVGRQAIYGLANNDVKELIFLMRKVVAQHAQETI